LTLERPTVLSGAKRGQMLGKTLLGLRVARADGASIGGIIDSLVALIDPRRRTLHDMLVGSVVLRAQS